MCHWCRASFSLSLQMSVCRIKGCLPRSASNCHRGMEKIWTTFSDVLWPRLVLHTPLHIYTTVFLSQDLTLLIFCLENWHNGGRKTITANNLLCCVSVTIWSYAMHRCKLLNSDSSTRGPSSAKQSLFFIRVSEAVGKNTCLAAAAGTTAWQLLFGSTTSASRSDWAYWWTWQS